MVGVNSLFAAITLGAMVLSGTHAHPGEHEGHSAFTLARRADFAETSRRSLDSCKNSVKARDLEARAIARRVAYAEGILRKREIKKRTVDYSMSKDHQTNLTGVSLDTLTDDLFSGSAKCVLHPEVTQGPYYVNGEHIRHDIREGEPGIDLWADIQMIDINTCEPIPNLYLDWWHTNSSGVYSGIVASGNGDDSDETNIDKTFLRGVTPTNEDGVVQIRSIFPGHYSGRTTHVHILAHLNATVHRNQTLIGGYVSHVGQLFFDQSLISEVELTEPYASNTQDVTLNSDDSIFSESAATSMDPVMEYALLGGKVENGIMAWITIAVDTNAVYSVASAATWTAHGGMVNSGSPGGGGGSGSERPSGSAPSGPAPSSYT